ncbi:hypothetical protein LTR17_018332 [Elasticomyces elasticus]|nr:hypothetical protein LTR17_018332 [Elasticomyces elasticus]
MSAAFVRAIFDHLMDAFDIKKCAACLNDESTQRITPVLDHHACYNCITAHFELATEDESHYPPRWGDHVLNIDDYAHALSTAVLERYMKKALEWEVRPDRRLYCTQVLSGAETKCDTFLGERTGGATNFRYSCEACDALSCPACGDIVPSMLRSSEPTHICDLAKLRTFDDMSDFGSLIRGKDFQICPGKRCGRKIELADGCNHVKCFCGEQFCYVCGIEANAYSGHWQADCPRYGQRGSRNAIYDHPPAPYGFRDDRGPMVHEGYHMLRPRAHYGVMELEEGIPTTPPSQLVDMFGEPLGEEERLGDRLREREVFEELPRHPGMTTAASMTHRNMVIPARHRRQRQASPAFNGGEIAWDDSDDEDMYGRVQSEGNQGMQRTAWHSSNMPNPSTATPGAQETAQNYRRYTTRRPFASIRNPFSPTTLSGQYDPGNEPLLSDWNNGAHGNLDVGPVNRTHERASSPTPAPERHSRGDFPGRAANRWPAPHNLARSGWLGAGRAHTRPMPATQQPEIPRGQDLRTSYRDLPSGDLHMGRPARSRMGYGAQAQYQSHRNDPAHYVDPRDLQVAAAPAHENHRQAQERAELAAQYHNQLNMMRYPEPLQAQFVRTRERIVRARAELHAPVNTGVTGIPGWREGAGRRR